MKFPDQIKRKGKTVHKRVKNMVLICRKPEVYKKGKSKSSKLQGLRDLDENASDKKLFGRLNSSEKFSWQTVESTKEASLSAIENSREVEWIAPVYSSAQNDDLNSMYALHPRVLLIQSKDNLDRLQNARLRKALGNYGLRKLKEKSKYLYGWDYYELSSAKNSVTVWDLRDKIEKEMKNVVAAVRYESIPMVKPTTYTPNDPLFGDQWNMTQIDATDAWDITEGNNEIVVAILDEGVDLAHPDLNFASNGFNLGTMSPTGAPTGDHGTPCAGIAAAATNNGSGVAGVAGSCLILPLAFDSWSDVEVAAGLGLAVSENADVVSMSFGSYGPGEGLFPANWDFDIIDPAIEAAHEAGLVLVAATGNEDVNTFNRYPARHDLVMAIGASSTDDNRKTTTSPDGEDFWGSNFANGVSVVAPGVLIPSTDRVGGAGYDSTNFVEDFNGTSAATPHVAGLAALVISMNPYLQNTDVGDVIELTADKVGTTAYTTVAGFENGTRNQPMGYGRINAEEAVNESGYLFTIMNELLNQ